MRLMVSMIGMNRLAGTREAVEAVLASTEPFYLSLTNQNSRDGTGAYFDSVKARHPDRVFVFHEKENTFFQPPNNRAYHMAATRGCDFFLCLNDDAIIPRDGLHKMMTLLDEQPDVGVVGAKGGCEEISDDFHGRHGKLEFVEGSCAMYRIAAMRQFRPTLFWDKLIHIYSEDSESSLFLQEKGYRIAKADFDLPHARSQTVNRDETTRKACLAAQEHNHKLCKERFAHWLKFRRMDYPIVLKRTYAIGDCLLLTPIIRAIAKSNPLSQIMVQTNYPELFERNPYVTYAAKEVALPHAALFIDLDGSYENMPLTHIVHGYEAETRKHLPGLGKVELRTELYPSKEDTAWAKEMRQKLAPESKLAIIGSDPTTWTGKNASDSIYLGVRNRLGNKGWATLAVGTKRTEIQTSISQLAALMGTADLFVGNDSFTLHAAQSMGVPSVGIFGATSARYILTQGSKATAAEASRSIPCAGERHRVSGKTYVPCNGDCINSITHEQVWSAIERLGVL